MSARVLVVGWDSADRRVVQALLAAGRLPALADLARRGVYRPINGYPGLGDDAHWCSFSTGLAPGDHGRFHYLQYYEGSYTERYITRAAARQPPFWAALDADAGPFAVIDIPKSPLALDGPRRARDRLVADIQVADWMTHGEEGPAVVIPADHPLTSRFVADPAFDCHRTVATSSALGAHAADIRRRGQRRATTMRELIDTEEWSLFLTVAAEAHCAGHHCWHLHDRELLGQGPESNPAIGDPLVQSLVDADNSLADLVGAAGPGAAIMVFSLIGMGPNVAGGNLSYQVLARYEALNRSHPRLAGLGRRVHAMVPRKRSQRSGHLAWVGKNDGVSTPIRLNLEGREARGLVRRGEHHRRVLGDLRTLFAGLIDEPSGLPLVREVIDVQDRYRGPHNDCFADLLVLWDTTRPITVAHSPVLGRFAVDSVLGRTGNHRDGGWLVHTDLHALGATPADLAPHDLADLITAELSARN